MVTSLTVSEYMELMPSPDFYGEKKIGEKIADKCLKVLSKFKKRGDGRDNFVSG